jgi:hypothetical protein
MSEPTLDRAGSCPGRRKKDGGPCGYLPAAGRQDGLCARHGELADAVSYAERFLTAPTPDPMEALADRLELNQPARRLRGPGRRPRAGYEPAGPPG